MLLWLRVLWSTLRRAAAFRGGFGGFRGGGFGGFRGGGFGGFHGGISAVEDFHFGGFGGGGSRFGDGGLFDRSSDAGFGRGGWGSIHNAGTFTDRADTFQQSHPEFQHNASQLQQNRFNEANTLQQNRYSGARSLQYNRETTWNDYHGSWGGYYSGLGLGAGFAIGATIAALPAAAYTLTVAGTPYWSCKRGLLRLASRTVHSRATATRRGRSGPAAILLDSRSWVRPDLRLRRGVL